MSVVGLDSLDSTREALSSFESWRVRGHIQEEGSGLVCACTRFNHCSLAESGCQAEQQLRQKYGALFCARLSVEDTVVPAAFLEWFPVVVNEAVVRTAPQLKQRM